jgi:oligopeptide transport system substrate-binding protein
MYEANEIHVAGVGLNDLHRVRDPSSPLRDELHKAPPGFQFTYIGLNVTRPPLDDPKVRQALAMSINKDLISERVLEDLQVPAWSILPPGFPGHNPDIEGLRYDLEEAKRLLSESKYGPDPSRIPPLTLTVAGQLGSAVGPDLQAILAGWRDHLGIDVAVQQMEFATFLNELHNFRLQMVAAAWIADYPDPQNFLDLLFHSASLNNEMRFSNEEVDRLLEAARSERDESVRFDLYRQAEAIIVNEAPVIPLWHAGEGNVLIKPQVKDFLLLPVIVPRYRFVYIEPEGAATPSEMARRGQ